MTKPSRQCKRAAPPPPPTFPRLAAAEIRSSFFLDTLEILLCLPRICPPICSSTFDLWSFLKRFRDYCHQPMALATAAHTKVDLLRQLRSRHGSSGLLAISAAMVLATLLTVTRSRSVHGGGEDRYIEDKFSVTQAWMLLHMRLRSVRSRGT